MFSFFPYSLSLLGSLFSKVSEWMSSKELCPFSSSARAVQLDLIGQVRGLESAETYFNNMTGEEKIYKMYGAMLNCYVRERMVDKSLSHLQKMKELGFASTPLPYNGLMCLYTNTNQLEKIPDVLLEMQENGVSPDSFSYRLCINSYGARSALNSMEKILKEMESKSNIHKDWITYAMVANFYIKAGLNGKALVFLKKAETKLHKDPLGCNHLISLYASLGSKAEVMRLWERRKTAPRKQINRDYITMLGSLVKLGEFEDAEALLKVWESSGNCYDFRVPNTLLIGYCQKGLIEKAESMLRDIVEKGKTPIPNSWSIVATGYIEKQNMEKAFECMKEAIAVLAEHKGWKPKPKIISSILSWLSDNKDVEEVETFVTALKAVIPMDREMYHVLIRASIRAGKEIDGILESMKADKINEDEETRKILSLKHDKAE